MQPAVEFTKVTSDNVEQTGIFCIKNKKAPGFKKKVKWFKDNFKQGLRMQVAVDDQGKQLGFIEYLPSEQAWRPIHAKNYLFIQCIALFVKDAKRKSIGSTLIQLCEQDAREKGKSGVCTMSSKGAWMANQSIFGKNDFTLVDSKGRFELMSKKFNKNDPDPEFVDWTKSSKKYSGWNLVYSDQCPWHEKSVTDLKNTALEEGINLNVVKLNTPQEAQQAPSGFGTFSLIKDGELIEDHYLSKTRFKNILKKFEA